MYRNMFCLQLWQKWLSVVVVSYLFNHLIDHNLIDHYVYIFIFEGFGKQAQSKPGKFYKLCSL